MAKLDITTGTALPTEDTLNAVQPLPKEQANALSAVAENNPSLNADTSLLASLNPNLTDEQRYTVNQMAGQSYAKIKDQQMGALEHIARAPVKVAFAALDYVPDVLNNAAGFMIGSGHGDFEDPSQQAAAVANIFGAGTTLGQILGQTYNKVTGQQAELDTGTDFFATDTSNIQLEKFKAQAQLYGWDTIDQYGGRTNLGSVVAGQLMNASKDSIEHKMFSTLTDTAAIGLQFVGINEIAQGLKFVGKGTKALREGGKLAGAMEAGKRSNVALNSLDALAGTEAQVAARVKAVELTRAHAGDEVADALADNLANGGDAIAALHDAAKMASDAHKTQATETAVQASAETISNATKDANRISANADAVDANLEAMRIAKEAEIAQITSGSANHVKNLDNEIISLTTRNNEISSKAVKTVDETNEFTANAKRIADANAEKQLLQEANVKVPVKNYDAARTVETIANDIKVKRAELKSLKESAAIKSTKAIQAKIVKAENEVKSLVEEHKVAKSTSGYKTVPVEEASIHPAAVPAHQAIEDIKTIQDSVRNIKRRFDRQSAKIANDAATRMGITPEKPIKTYADATAFLKEHAGGRMGPNGVDQLNINTALNWVTSGGIDGIAKAILDINKVNPNEAFSMIYSILRGKELPVIYVRRLAKATSEQEVKAIFAAALSQGHLSSDFGKVRMLKWQSRVLDANGNVRTMASYSNAYDSVLKQMYALGKDVVARGLIWGNDKKNILVPWAKSYDTMNSDDMVQGTVDSIEFIAGKFGISFVGNKGRQWRQFKNEWVTKMGLAETSEERHQIWYKMQESLIDLAGGAEGVSETQRKVLSTAFRRVKAEHDKEIKRLAEMESKEATNKLVAGGTVEEKTLAQAIIYEMHMSTQVSMINPYELRRMIKTGKSIEQIQDKIDNAAGFKKAYYYGKDALISLVETVYDKWFRRAVLFRMGYVVRNTLETQMRMFLKGHPSAFSDPFFLVSALFSNNKNGKISSFLDNYTKENFSKFIDWKSKNNVDVAGNPFGQVSKLTLRVQEIDAEVAKINNRITKLNDKIKLLDNPEEANSLRKQVDDLENSRTELFTERDSIDVNSILEEEVAQFFKENSVRENITNPGEAPGKGSSVTNKEYELIGLDHKDYDKGIAEYVYNIATDDIAKAVLASAAGRPLSREIRSYVGTHKLEKLSAEEQILEYYYYGPGRTIIDALSKAQDGRNAKLFETKDALREHLFGNNELSYKTLVDNFTNGFDESLVDVILEAKFTKVNGEGKIVVKRYPVEKGDVNATVKPNRKQQLKDIEDAYKDTLNDWKVNNGANAKVIRVPKSRYDNQRAPLAAVVEFITNASDKIYDWSAAAEKTFATVPEFKYAHWDYVASVVHALSPADAAKVVTTAEKLLGKSVNGSWASNTLRTIKKNAKFAAGDGTFVIDDVIVAANNYASREVSKLFYDASKRNAFGHALRFISPFGQAWANSMLTWSKLALKNPQQVYKAELFYKSLESQGSGWLYNPLGIEIQNEYDVNEPFIHNDPKTGKPVFGIPFEGPLAAGLANLAGALEGQPANLNVSNIGSTIDVNSMNLLFQNGILPGFGPVIQIPMSTLEGNDIFNRLVPDFIKDIITPNRSTADTPFTIEGQLLPAWGKEALSGLTRGAAFPEIRNKYMTGAMNILLETQPEKYYDASTGSLTSSTGAALIHDAEVISNALALTRGIAQFFMPGSTKIETKTLDKNGEYHLMTAIGGEYHDLLAQGYDQVEAMTKIVDTYGIDSFTSMVTTSNSGYTPTNAAWDAVKANPNLLRTDGNVLSLFYVNGGYSVELDKSLNTGSNKLTPQQYVEQVNKMKFAARQGVLDSKLATGTITPDDYDASTQALKNSAKNVPMPAANFNWRSQTFNEIDNAFKNNAELAQTEAGQAFKEYSAARAAAIAYGDLDNKSQYQRRVMLFDIGTQLSAKYPQFSVMWYRALRGEVKPLNGELQQGAK